MSDNTNAPKAAAPAVAQAEPSDEQVIAMNPYLNDEVLQALWLNAFRMAELFHGISSKQTKGAV